MDNPAAQAMIGRARLGSYDLMARIVFAMLLGASLAPVLLVRIPAMVDYPNHLARMYVMVRDGTGEANPYYHTGWALYPNLAMELLVPQIARFVSVESAMRLFLLLSQGLIVSGALVLERVVKGRMEIAGFAAVMFLYCLPFAWGFVNFEFGLGLALWGIAAMVAVQERSWPVRLAVNAGFVVTLFAAHFFALGVYGAALGLYELWQAWDRKARLGQTALRLALLALPALALLAVMGLTAGAIGSSGNIWRFEFKPLWLIFIASGYSPALSSASMAALLSIIYITCKRGLLKVTPPGLWIGSGFVVLYLAIPSRLLGTAFSDLRMIVAATLILPAFCTLALPHARWKQAALTVAAVITLANLAVVYLVWLSYRADYAAMIESFGRIERGARVLVGTTGQGDDPPSHDLIEYPMYHAPTLAVAYANAFVPTFFATSGKQPVKARADVEQLTISDGALVPVTMLTDIAAGRPVGELASFVGNWTRDYDYLYLLGSRIANPIPERLLELSNSARFTLYKIRRVP